MSTATGETMRKILASAMLIGFGCHCSSALAQTAGTNGGSTSAVGGTTPNGLSLGGSRQGPGELSLPTQQAPAPASTANGPLSAFGHQLNNDGVRVDVSLVEQFVANPNSGSVKNQTSNVTVFGVNAEFDMGKLANIEGGSIHLFESVYGLKSNTSEINNIGGSIGNLQIIKEYVPDTLTEVTYEQKLVGGRYDVEVGRTNIVRYFFLPNCDNAFACQSAIINGPLSVPPIRYAEWGGRMSVRLNGPLFVQFGAFEDNLHAERTNGFRFGDSTTTGVLSVAELTYRTDFTTAAYPGRYELGAFGDTATFTDPYTSALGRSIVAHPKDPVTTDHNPTALFLWGQQTVWRQDGGKGHAPLPANLALYGTWIQTVNPHQNYTAEGWAGFSLTGIIPGRPFDHFGLKLHYANLGQRELEYQEAERVAVGGPAIAQSRNLYAVEAADHIQLVPGASLEADVQYIINADSQTNSRSNLAPQDGFVFGLELVLSAADFLGLQRPH